MIISAGRMVGDFEMINNIPSMMSLKCCSPEASVKVMDRKMFMKLKQFTDDWKYMSHESEEQQVLFMSYYASMLRNTKELKHKDGDENKKDFKILSSNLMNERILDEKSSKALQMYSIKKHMMRDASLRLTNINELNKNQLEDLKESEWAQYLMDKRPGTVDEDRVPRKQIPSLD